MIDNWDKLTGEEQNSIINVCGDYDVVFVYKKIAYGYMVELITRMQEQRLLNEAPEKEYHTAQWVVLRNQVTLVRSLIKQAVQIYDLIQKVQKLNYLHEKELANMAIAISGSTSIDNLT